MNLSQRAEMLRFAGDKEVTIGQTTYRLMGTTFGGQTSRYWLYKEIDYPNFVWLCDDGEVIEWDDSELLTALDGLVLECVDQQLAELVVKMLGTSDLCYTMELSYLGGSIVTLSLE